jgi:hypothetical protein
MARAAVDNEMAVTSRAVTSVTRQLSQVYGMCCKLSKSAYFEMHLYRALSTYAIVYRLYCDCVGSCSK